MLTGYIFCNYNTKRLAVYWNGNSFDIPDQELAKPYYGSKVNFFINEMDDATDISIISL